MFFRHIIQRHRERLPKVGTAIVCAALAACCLLPVAPSAGAQDRQIAEQPDSQPIIGGTSAVPGQYPFAVSLQLIASRWRVDAPGYDWEDWVPTDESDQRGRHQCGGTVNAPEWILTAAHCLHQRTADFIIPFEFEFESEVLTGVTVFDSKTSGELLAIEEVHVHPAWTGFTAPDGSDIALLKLASPTTAPPVSLHDVAPSKAFSAWLVGWGTTAGSGGGTSNTLQQVLLPATSPAVCGGIPGTLCFEPADPTAPHQGACYGDSGGPALLKTKTTPYRQVGVTSFGVAGCTGYSAYTHVGSYAGWIQCVSGVVVHSAGSEFPVECVSEQ